MLLPFCNLCFTTYTIFELDEDSASALPLAIRTALLAQFARGKVVKNKFTPPTSLSCGASKQLRITCTLLFVPTVGSAYKTTLE